jgi:hypothetical protein
MLHTNTRLGMVIALHAATAMSKSGLDAPSAPRRNSNWPAEEADRILGEEVVRPATGMAPTMVFREVGIEP